MVSIIAMFGSNSQAEWPSLIQTPPNSQIVAYQKVTCTNEATPLLCFGWGHSQTTPHTLDRVVGGGGGGGARARAYIRN